MRGNGGVIGAPNLPTAATANGTWGCNDAARNLAGRSAGNGMLWPYAPNDAQFANVLALYHCDEASGQSLIDYSSYRFNASKLNFGGGNNVRTRATGGPFGGRCVDSVGNTASTGGSCFYGRLGAAVGTGDFTYEGWVYPTTNGINRELLDGRSTDGVVNGPFVVIKSSNVLAYLTSGSAYDISGSTTVSLNTWHHWHATRISGVVYLGLDGVQEGADFSSSNNFTDKDLWIGAQVSSGNAQIIGKYAEIRVSAYARYSRTYTVPTAPFPDHG